MALKKVLQLQGSDTSAGAGMQADLKTFQVRYVWNGGFDIYRYDG